MKRSGSSTQGYQPTYANQQAQARCWRGFRLGAGYPDVRGGPLPPQPGLVPRSRSPGVLPGSPVISHESIYRFIYAQLAGKKDYSWCHYLPRAKSKRGWQGRKGGSPASFIAQRRPLAQRPKAATDRKTPGHGEADLMLFRTYGQAALTLHERHSRLLIALRLPGKAADPIAVPSRTGHGPLASPVATYGRL